MNAKKILLAFDGSAQSFDAARVCWRLAADLPVFITAHHVVNTAGLWRLLNFDLPGLTGSGIYIEARESMAKELRKIGEKLVEIYQSKAPAIIGSDDCLIDEGETVVEIMRRSADHDMVVVGHHPWAPKQNREAQLDILLDDKPHFSTVETLAQYCEKPLLVVQDRCSPWNRVKLLLHGGTNVGFSFRAAADFANFLNVPLEVGSFIKGDEKLEDLPDLTELIKESSANYPDMDLKISRAKLWPEEQSANLANVDCAADTLVIIPTFVTDNKRCTVFGTCTKSLIRYCGLPAVLLWPADVAVAPASQYRSTKTATAAGK